MSTEPVVYQLRRPTSDKSWGFALQGGADQGLPVFVHKVGSPSNQNLNTFNVICALMMLKRPLKGPSNFSASEIGSS